VRVRLAECACVFARVCVRTVAARAWAEGVWAGPVCVCVCVFVRVCVHTQKCAARAWGEGVWTGLVATAGVDDMGGGIRAYLVVLWLASSKMPAATPFDQQPQHIKCRLSNALCCCIAADRQVPDCLKTREREKETFCNEHDTAVPAPR